VLPKSDWYNKSSKTIRRKTSLAIDMMRHSGGLKEDGAFSLRKCPKRRLWIDLKLSNRGYSFLGNKYWKLSDKKLMKIAETWEVLEIPKIYR
jgi:hypothetical protein